MILTVRRAPTLLLMVALGVFSLVATSGHAQQSTPKPLRGKLTVSGAATLFPLMNDIARRYESLHAGVTIDVRSAGSGKGLADVRAGAVDIGMMSRALLNDEGDLFAYPIARDGVAVIVHRDNPVKGVTRQQLSALLTGQITNWKTLTGQHAPVNVAWRRGHGSFELMLERLNLKREQIVGQVLTGPTEDGIKFAAANKNGLTLASVGESERSMRSGVPIKLLAYNGVPASSRTIQNHGYALSRPLTLITRQLPQGLQKQFIDYALSQDVIDLQVKYGFVPYQE
jgi:phosphate transport system substrate-binding protein